MRSVEGQVAHQQALHDLTTSRPVSEVREEMIRKAMADTDYLDECSDLVNDEFGPADPVWRECRDEARDRRVAEKLADIALETWGFKP